jgi:hypothetical protein
MIAVPFTATFTSRVNAAEITVTWTEVQHQVRPRQMTGSVTKTVRLTLQGGNAISDSFEARTMRGRSRQANYQGKLREGMERGKSSVAWRVGDSKTLIRTASYPQFVQTIHVRTLSETTCKAEVSNRIKPGFREYAMRSIATGEPMYFSSIHAENVTCSIRN